MKPNLREIIYNEQRIMELQGLLSEKILEISKIQQGDFRYRGLWLLKHHYELEIEERQKIGEKYKDRLKC
jgi:hypothetical protein